MFYGRDRQVFMKRTEEGFMWQPVGWIRTRKPSSHHCPFRTSSRETRSRQILVLLFCSPCPSICSLAPPPPLPRGEKNEGRGRSVVAPRWVGAMAGLSASLLLLVDPERSIEPREPLCMEAALMKLMERRVWRGGRLSAPTREAEVFEAVKFF